MYVFSKNDRHFHLMGFQHFVRYYDNTSDGSGVWMHVHTSVRFEIGLLLQIHFKSLSTNLKAMHVLNGKLSTLGRIIADKTYI